MNLWPTNSGLELTRLALLLRQYPAPFGNQAPATHIPCCLYVTRIDLRDCSRLLAS